MASGPEASVSFDISEEVKAHVEAEIAKAQAEFDRLRQERDEARIWVTRIFRKLEMTEQLYGSGSRIIAANPWMLEEGPWQETEPWEDTD